MKRFSYITRIATAILMLSSMSATATATVFIVLGDSRPLISKAPQPLVFKRIIEESNLIRPDFIINVGDLIFGYMGKASEIDREYQDFKRVINASLSPFYPVVGNHDIVGEDGEAFYQKYLGPLYYSFDKGKDHFIALDSDIGGADTGTLGPEQMRWLEDDLEKNKDARNIFVFVHKPMYGNADSDSTAWASIDEVRRVEELFIRYGVNIVFAGHHHKYGRFERRGIIYYITGGGGAETGRPENNEFSHYLYVRSRATSIDVRVVEPLHVWVEYPETNAETTEQATVKVLVSQRNLYPMRLRGVQVKIRSLRPGERYAARGARIVSAEPDGDITTITLSTVVGELGIGYKEIPVFIVPAPSE